MKEKEKISHGESLVLEMYDSIIQDPVEKKILAFVIKNKTPEEFLEESLCDEEKL